MGGDVVCGVEGGTTVGVGSVEGAGGLGGVLVHPATTPAMLAHKPVRCRSRVKWVWVMHRSLRRAGCAVHESGV